MSVNAGYVKYKKHIKESDGTYSLCSFWTSSNTVHFDDGATAESKVGAISGITDSLTATNSNVALSAAGGKNLQDQITTLNSNLTNFIPYATHTFVLYGMISKMQNDKHGDMRYVVFVPYLYATQCKSITLINIIIQGIAVITNADDMTITHNFFNGIQLSFSSDTDYSGYFADVIVTLEY